MGDITGFGLAREVPKNLEMLEDTGEVRMLHPDHLVVPHPDQIPHQMPHLKPMLMPQPGITHITQAIMDITDTASAILDITGDEDKNLEFFSTSKHNKFKHNMDLMELVQKNSKIVLNALGRIWLNKFGKI